MDIGSIITSPWFAGQVRHAMTGIAGSLITAGAITSNQQDQFVAIGSGVVVYLIGAIWSWWQKTGQAEVAAELERLKAQRRPLTSDVVQKAMMNKN